MEYLFRKTNVFYPGFQRRRLFADPAVRLVILMFITATIIEQAVIMLADESLWPIFDIIRDIFILLPFGIIIAGGISRRDWIAHFALSAACAACLALIYLRGEIFLLIPSAAAFFLLIRLHLRTGVLKAFGYCEKPRPFAEILMVIIIGSLAVVFSYIALIKLHHSRFINPDIMTYSLVIFGYLKSYCLFYGVTYGVMTRRLLDAKYTVFAPFAVNTLAIAILWAPATLAINDPAKAIPAAILSCIASQLTLTLGFYYCRTTRAVAAAYAVYFIFYKSVAV